MHCFLLISWIFILSCVSNNWVSVLSVSKVYTIPSQDTISVLITMVWRHLYDVSNHFQMFSSKNESLVYVLSTLLLFSPALYNPMEELTSLLCHPLSPRVCSNSCPLNLWCCLIIVSSITHFSFCLNLSMHQGFIHWVSSLPQVAKVFELQHQSFEWIFRKYLFHLGLIGLNSL